jgi:hypothetical protein
VSDHHLAISSRADFGLASVTRKILFRVDFCSGHALQTSAGFACHAGGHASLMGRGARGDVAGTMRHCFSQPWRLKDQISGCQYLGPTGGFHLGEQVQGSEISR